MALNTIPTHPDSDSYASLDEALEYLVMKKNFSVWQDLDDEVQEGYLRMATRQIDALRFCGIKKVPEAMYYRKEQKRLLPMYDCDDFGFSPTSVGTLTVTSTVLANLAYMPDDYWNKGALIVTDGTGRGQTLSITDFVSSTGTITVATMATTLDTTSQCMLVEEIEEEIKNATIEQAYYLAMGEDENIKARMQGVKSVSIGDVSESYSTPYTATINGISYSLETLAYLQGYLSHTGSIIT